MTKLLLFTPATFDDNENSLSYLIYECGHLNSTILANSIWIWRVLLNPLNIRVHLSPFRWRIKILNILTSDNNLQILLKKWWFIRIFLLLIGNPQTFAMWLILHMYSINIHVYICSWGYDKQCHYFPLQCLAWSREGEKILFGSVCHIVHVWVEITQYKPLKAQVQQLYSGSMRPKCPACTPTIQTTDINEPEHVDNNN